MFLEIIHIFLTRVRYQFEDNKLMVLSKNELLPSKNLCPPDHHTCVFVAGLISDLFTLCCFNELYTLVWISTRCWKVALGICVHSAKRALVC